jgi:hypothetical protein
LDAAKTPSFIIKRIQRGCLLTSSNLAGAAKIEAEQLKLSFSSTFGVPFSEVPGLRIRASSAGLLVSNQAMTTLDTPYTASIFLHSAQLCHESLAENIEDQVRPNLALGEGPS